MPLADYYTLLLIVAPFVIPRALNYGLQWVASRNATHGKANGSATTQAVHVVNIVDALPPSRFVHARKLLLCSSVIIFSIFQLLNRRPFNLFTSLQDGLPLTTHTSQLQSLLRWRGLSATWSHVPPLLTSLEARLVYAHFGQDTFLGCLGLCRPDSTGDHLAYAAVRLFRHYVLVAIALCLANKRWKNWLASLAAAGFTAEVFWLATSEIRTRSDGSANCLADRFFVYRHAGLAFTAVITALLPTRQPQLQISPDEANVLAGVQALNQKQDSTQTRIRAIQIVQDPRLAVSMEKTSPAAALTAEQKQELQAWLEGILARSGSDGATPTAAVASESPQASRHQGDQISARKGSVSRAPARRASKDNNTESSEQPAMSSSRSAARSSSAHKQIDAEGADNSRSSSNSSTSLSLPASEHFAKITQPADAQPVSAFSADTDETTMHTSDADFSHDMSVVGDMASYTMETEEIDDTSLLGPTRGNDAFIADSGATRDLQLRLNHAIRSNGSGADASPSGSDSPIMTPTPATNLPPSFELIASSLLAASTSRGAEEQRQSAQDVALTSVEAGIAALDIRGDRHASTPGANDMEWTTVESRRKQVRR